MEIDLKEVVTLIPTIMIYFVPGIIYLTTYRFIVTDDSKVSENNYFSFGAIVVSFIIYSIVAFFITVLNIPCIEIEINKDLSFSSNYLLIYIASFSLAVILGKLARVQWFEEKILGNWLKRTQNDLWFSLADRELGCYITIFLNDKDEIIRGIYYKYYNENGNTWVVVSQFIKFGFDGIIKEDHSDCNTRMAVICMSDIKKVYIDYNEKSVKIHEKVRIPAQLKILNYR